MEINIQANEHFIDYLNNWDKRFYYIVGGYGSSKSYHTALKLILKAIQEKRRILVVRAVYRTIKESCFSLLKGIISNYNLNSFFTYTTNPLHIRGRNGSEFIFMGLDDADKLKSIDNVDMIWIEECPEISYDAFNELNGRLRALGKDLHIFLTNNPVSVNNWTYERFIKKAGIDEEELYQNRIITTDDTYYHHSVVTDNAFVNDEYIQQLKNFETYDIERYRIAFQGRFGIVGERVFTNIQKANDTEVQAIVQELSKYGLGNLYDGLDYGFSISYNALVRMAIDRENNVLYIYDELYNKNLITSELIASMNYIKQKHREIIADSARPETTEEIRRAGFKIINAEKGQGSVLDGLQKLKSFYKIIVSDKCINTYRELTELCHEKDKNGNYVENKFTLDPHTVDAMRYGLEKYKATTFKNGEIKKPIGV